MLSAHLLAALSLLLGQVPHSPTTPDSVSPEAVAPELHPGLGWGAPTLPQVRPGFFEELAVVAHWTRMDNQILWRSHERDIYLGVLAYHRSLIDHVEFAVDGGPWVTRTEPGLSPQTQYYEYGVRLRAAEFATGWHEVRARAVPRQGLDQGGMDRVLEWRFFAGQALVPGVHYGLRWVDPVGGDDLASGLRDAPFATFARAVESLRASTTGADGGVIYLMGQNVLIPVGANVPVVNNSLPLTVRAESGQRPYFAPQSTGGTELLPIRNLRLEHLRIDASWNEMFQHGPAQPNAHLYISGCEFLGHTVPRSWPPSNFPTVYRLTGLHNYDLGRNVWMADCHMLNIDGSCHGFIGWMRGVHVRRGLVGGFGGSRCIIDCSVRDSPETLNFSSSGLWVGSWAGADDPVENVLVDGLRVLDHSGLLIDVARPCNGVAVVNSTFDGVNGTTFSQSEVGSVFIGEQRHILLLHCTSPQRLEIDYPQNFLFRYMLGGWVSSCIFGDLYDRQLLGAPANANPGGNPNNDGLSGPVVGLQLDPVNMHVHGNRPIWASWSQQGYAPTYVDIWSNKLRVRSSSQASLTVSPSSRILDFDGLARRRGDDSGWTTVGARIGQAE